jgi:hypothetical protein
MLVIWLFDTINSFKLGYLATKFKSCNLLCEKLIDETEGIENTISVNWQLINAMVVKC